MVQTTIQPLRFIQQPLQRARAHGLVRDGRFETIYVVLKVAEVCNLGCRYCYFFEGGDMSFERDPKFIAESTVEGLGRFLAQGVEELGICNVEISMHGGEPLMIGKRRFETFCRVLNRHVAPVAKLALSIQTNATLLDEEWVKLLSAYEVSIGVSLDGPRHIHDHERVTKRGKGSYDAVLRGIDVLRRAQNIGLIPGFAVGCVVNPDADAAEIYDHFVHELGFESLAFRPPIMDWTDYSVEVNSKVTKFYRTLVDAWLKDANPSIRIEFLSRILTAMLSDDGARTYARAVRNLFPTFSVRSNGDLCPDDALPPKDPQFRHTGMNVDNSTLRSFFSAQFWEGIDSQDVALDAECEKCRWLGICRGGPAEERYAGAGRFSSRTVYCDTRKSVFEAIYEVVGSACGYDTLDRRVLSTLQDT